MQRFSSSVDRIYLRFDALHTLYSSSIYVLCSVYSLTEHSITNTNSNYSMLHCHILSPYYRCAIGTRRIFSGGGQIKGSGDESLPAGSRGGAPVRVWGKAPRNRQKVVKISKIVHK